MRHVNGVNAPKAMQHWLTDRMSLTKKLIAHSDSFRVQRLMQQPARCLHDEYKMVALPRRECVQERDVLLRCDGVAMVYGHTVVPLTATAQDWPFFSSLGERSLGTTLFGDPLVSRGELQYARLPRSHPLLERARRVLGEEVGRGSLFARRCLYQRRNGLLLVTEVFLPAITGLARVAKQSTTNEYGVMVPNPDGMHDCAIG
jgi:chorismate--pyruvate lyase